MREDEMLRYGEDTARRMDAERFRSDRQEAMVTAMRTAMYEQMRGLMIRGMRDSEARRILRIEVERDRQYELEEVLYRHGGRFPLDKPRPGPMQWEGVDVYVVDLLPAPGWRVINPFRKN